MSDDRQALRDDVRLAALVGSNAWPRSSERVALGDHECDAILNALLADPVPLLREIAAATKPCETCGQFAGSIHEGQMPGHVYGSNWDWVPCQTCHGSGRVPAVDRAALLAALGMEQVGDWVTNPTDPHYCDPDHAVHRHRETCDENPPCVPVWAARVSEETP